MKKILVLLLATLMLASLLAGCANNGDTNEDTSKNEEQSNVLDNLNVPDKKYGGEEFMFLTRDAAEWTTVDIYAEELTSDPINDAVYRRNDAIQSKYDLVILENVGNLVCPAEFDTGAVKNMTILSVPEGHDKPLKYPLMYETCQLLVVNKTDVEDYFDFDREKVVEYAKMRNPDIEILFLSAKTGQGVPQLAEWILRQAEAWNG